MTRETLNRQVPSIYRMKQGGILLLAARIDRVNIIDENKPLLYEKVFVQNIVVAIDVFNGW